MTYTDRAVGLAIALSRRYAVPDRRQDRDSGMIVNAPTADALDRVALRLHFRSWTELMGIIEDFALNFEFFDPTGLSENKDLWAEEWAEYLQDCQPDLQSIASIVQQANELALKARLCAVSPFLLLLKTDPKFANGAADLDFSELRTLDAVDLPAAVNTFCAKRLSDDFVRTYTELRSLRNKVVHLGDASATFTPQGLMKLMVRQFIELWPNRQWLTEWLAVETGSRYAIFHDGRHQSAHAEVLHRWADAVPLIPKSDFKQLFGYAKSRRRYHCPICAEAARTKWSTPWEDTGSATAFLDGDAGQIHCVACGERFAVARERCRECPGDVIAAGDTDAAGCCLSCGSFG
ncbi:hypothetical protein [Devosia sp. MC1541]|uniref:hypothetical protein n=1 Tax=Devosia sp. MC1541 TaxID=2725264 RepID=UPI00145CCCB8|nr:hypothetical protein [Devosia sp. MC1541]